MSQRTLIDIFSPLPPLPTAIGNYALAVLGALRDLARVRVWTSQEGQIEMDIPGVELCRFKPKALPIARLNQADATFYNIGNNASFHRDIHFVARQIPGIVILHDARLQHFFAAYSEHEGEERAYYLDSLERSYGHVVRAMGEAFIEGRGPLQDLVNIAPMTLSALDGAIGGILHNAEEYVALASQTHLPVYYLPLPFCFGPAPTRLPLRDSDAPSQLVIFGFIGENRRLLPILEAFADMPDREHYRLDIYGIVEKAQEADEFISSAGLSELVKRRGFVSELELNEALANADLALNLRWPSMGEASDSQLRIWAARLPALVTKVGWYAQLPQNTVFMIDIDHERDQIVQHLRALRKTPSLYVEAGRKGRQILEQQNSPEHYAKGLMAIALDHPAQHARRVGHALAERAAQLLLEISPNALARLLGDEISGHIVELMGN